MLRRRTGLAGTFSLLFALILAACGQVGTDAQPNDATATPVVPSIKQQPVSQSVGAGQVVSFSVVATGSAPLSYQWRKNGATVNGAVAATYSAPATVEDDGSTFSVAVSNTAGMVESDSAMLRVLPSAVAPTITSQPTNQSITAGQTATFSVTATGTDPLSYRWQRNGADIAGATSARYTTPAATTSDSGATFAVVVSNPAGSINSRPATLSVTAAGPTAPSITTQPADQSIQSGQTATFSVVTAGSAPLSYQWRKNGTAIAGATGTSYTTPAETIGDNGATFAVVVSNTLGTATSRSARLTVTSVPTGGVDVVTYKYDRSRTGQNQNEKILTPANVTAASFGKLRLLSTDGKVDAQPLYLSALNIGGVSHNVVFVATEHDSIYAFDADSGAQLWKSSLVPAGEVVGNDSCLQTTGVMATPVIDRSAGAHGTLYAVARTQSGTNYIHRLHALDVTTGAELLGGPTLITATAPKSGGTLTFDPAQANERAALLLNNGTIYTTWTSRCDLYFYTGWIMTYSQSTLKQTAVLNVAPNSGGVGPAIWMSGGGPAADAANNVYLITANGVFDTALDASGFPNMGDFGNSFLKLTLSGNSLTVTDYFAPYNGVTLSGTDKDLGSGGLILLPDQTDSSGTTRHIIIGAGKDGNIYLLNRDSLGHFSATGNNIWQQLTSILGNLGEFPATGRGGIWSTPAYFNNHVYFSPVYDTLKSFSYSSARLSTAPVASTAVTFVPPGALPVVSANGTANAIVWAHQNTDPAVLYAFDANTLAQLYSSSTAANARDQFGPGNKFIAPVVANGKVFVGTTNGVAVFGLLQ